MPAESTSRYPTLRRTRTALRVLAPIVSTTALLTGLTMFARVAPRLVSLTFGVQERMILGAVGLGYLIGAPIVAFVCFFLLRAGADLIDLWIDQQIAAEKTADLVERQLVPGILRMCQLLEKSQESSAAQTLTKPAAEPTAAEARQQAIDAVVEAIRREWWDQARRLAAAFAERYPDAPDAKELASRVETAYARKVQLLREQLDQAEKAGDAEGLLNARDRLSAYLNGTQLHQVDRRVAHWMATLLRAALVQGKAREVVGLAERVADSFGDTTPEGGQVRSSLPTLRRSAGLCPDCGQPYDVSLARCLACEAKRAAKKPAPATMRKK